METINSSEKDPNSLKVLKIVAWPIGIWPLSDNLFSIFRIFIFIITQVLKHLYFNNKYNFLNK